LGLEAGLQMAREGWRSIRGRGIKKPKTFNLHQKKHSLNISFIFIFIFLLVQTVLFNIAPTDLFSVWQQA